LAQEKAERLAKENATREAEAARKKAEVERLANEKRPGKLRDSRTGSRDCP